MLCIEDISLPVSYSLGTICYESPVLSFHKRWTFRAGTDSSSLADASL